MVKKLKKVINIAAPVIFWGAAVVCMVTCAMNGYKESEEKGNPVTVNSDTLGRYIYLDGLGCYHVRRCAITRCTNDGDNTDLSGHYLLTRIDTADFYIDNVNTDFCARCVTDKKYHLLMELSRRNTSE